MSSHEANEKQITKIENLVDKFELDLIEAK